MGLRPIRCRAKNNVKRQWWKYMVMGREDIVGIDSCVILAREVWEASGHVATFSDPLTECTACHKRYRADHLEEAYEAKHKKVPESLADINCPACGNKGQFTTPKQFSGLLKTYLGPVEDESGLAYLRPETAQGIFINFDQVMTTSRKNHHLESDRLENLSEMKLLQETLFSVLESLNKWRWNFCSSRHR